MAAAGEWRTNISLGGRLESADPPPEAVAEAERAARALAIDLAGVDLLPWDDDWVVLELNGAADFDERYSLGGRDVHAEIARALALGRTAVACAAPRDRVVLEGIRGSGLWLVAASRCADRVPILCRPRRSRHSLQPASQLAPPLPKGLCHVLVVGRIRGSPGAENGRSVTSMRRRCRQSAWRWVVHSGSSRRGGRRAGRVPVSPPRAHRSPARQPPPG